MNDEIWPPGTAVKYLGSSYPELHGNLATVVSYIDTSPYGNPRYDILIDGRRDKTHFCASIYLELAQVPDFEFEVTA